MNGSVNKFAPVIVGTMITSLLSLLPIVNIINIFLCAGVVIGGYIASNTYLKQCIQNNRNVYFKDAVIIGLLSGLLSGVIVALANLIVTMISKENPGLIALEITEKIPNFPESVKLELKKISQEFTEFGFSRTVAIISIISNLIIYPLFSMLGAILRISMFTKSGKMYNKRENFPPGG